MLMSLLDQRDDSLRVSSALSLSDKITKTEETLKFVEDIYGLSSSPAAALHIQRSYFYILENHVNEAERELLSAGQCASETDLPLELTIVALYLCGLVCPLLLSSFFLFLFSFFLFCLIVLEIDLNISNEERENFLYVCMYGWMDGWMVYIISLWIISTDSFDSLFRIP